MSSAQLYDTIWRDPIAGLREMRRVARRVVFTHDTSVTTLPPAGGPNATATSSLSIQRNWAFACS